MVMARKQRCAVTASTDGRKKQLQKIFHALAELHNCFTLLAGILWLDTAASSMRKYQLYANR